MTARRAQQECEKKTWWEDGRKIGDGGPALLTEHSFTQPSRGSKQSLVALRGELHRTALNFGAIFQPCMRSLTLPLRSDLSTGAISFPSRITGSNPRVSSSLVLCFERPSSAPPPREL